MKYYFFLFAFAITISSCKKNKTKNLTPCKTSDFIIKDTIFSKSEILSSIYYDHNCKINKLEILTLLDGRSGNLKTKSNLNDVTLNLGILSDTITHLLIKKDNVKIVKHKNDFLLYVEHIFKNPFLDSLNLIDLKTISIEKADSKTKILQSESYFYKNSKELLNIKDTYLDYNAFSNKKLIYKILDYNKDNINAILFTIKAENIDQITDYNALINNHNLNFKYSINASYDNFKKESKGCFIYDVIKLNANFLQFKVNINQLDLKKIDKIAVKLNDKI